MAIHDLKLVVRLVKAHAVRGMLSMLLEELASPAVQLSLRHC